MLIRSNTNISNAPDFEDLRKFSATLLNEIVSVINGGLEFGSNLKTQTIVKSVTAGVEFTIGHTLKRIPSGYFIVRMNVANTLIDGTKEWTTESISLIPSATGKVTFIVF